MPYSGLEIVSCFDGVELGVHISILQLVCVYLQSIIGKQGHRERLDERIIEEKEVL